MKILRNNYRFREEIIVKIYELINIIMNKKIDRFYY